MSGASVPRRFGLVIGIRPEYIDQYRTLHQGPGVRDLLTAANIRNFSIFLLRLPDGKFYEFGYYEYVGDDYEADMATLTVDPRYTEWLEVCDPMQVPLPGECGWAKMEQIYFNP